MNQVEVIAYSPAYREYFIDLNIEWLEKYFAIEPHDKIVFENIEELILKPGGEIFFIRCGDEIVGTAAMQKIDSHSYELIKMAVTEKHQGKGFSKLLMKNCIAFAKKKMASKIIILSNRSLLPALSLYKAFGFTEVPLEATDYSRANIQMELRLA